jgi:hypothetical protein
MDTETTGLSLNDDIWEFACIIREPGQEDVEIQTFVRHDEDKARQLPKAFFDDYCDRYDHDLAIPQVELARLVLDLTGGRAHIVGAVPNFDTDRLSIVLHRHGYIPAWHYHLIDVENLAVGYLAGRASQGDLDAGLALPDLPWDSDVLSAALGVTAPVEDRHTALGDCRWARDIFDAVTGERYSR